VVRKNRRLLFALTVAIIFSVQIYNLAPQHLALRDGENYPLPPFISGLKNSSDTQLKLFGFVPIKTVEVDIVPKVDLIPCGNTIGVKINIDGVMIVGFSEIRSTDGKRHNPAKDGALKIGDVIKKINGNFVENIDILSKIVENGKGGNLSVEVARGNFTQTFNIKPELAREDNIYKIGAWVRDSTSGIGTLTFIEPKSKVFAALGHPITDSDTGDIITVGNGEILHSNIVGVQKGARGSPGELRGVFSRSQKIGDIQINNEAGIYGKMKIVNAENKPMPIAMRSQINEGKAYILSNIESDKVEKYDIEIQKVMRNSYDNKGMVIKVIDERLIKKTGGIVQGMSGSPIIQNGNIVGAVTHVFVNDPTRGYGTFIELMLDKANNIDKSE